MGPTTRSKLGFTQTNVEEIRRTLDPIQITYHTDHTKLPVWRKVLNLRYVDEFRPQGVTTTWEDYGEHHTIYEHLIDPDLSSLPKDLVHSTIRLKDGRRQLLVIHVYYTTASFLVQGRSCRQWVDREFAALRDIVNALAAQSGHSQLALPSRVDSALPVDHDSLTNTEMDDTVSPTGKDNAISGSCARAVITTLVGDSSTTINTSDSVISTGTSDVGITDNPTTITTSDNVDSVSAANTSDIGSTGTTISDSVNSAGAANTSDIGSTGTTISDSVNSASAANTSDIGSTGTTISDSVNSACAANAFDVGSTSTNVTISNSLNSAGAANTFNTGSTGTSIATSDHDSSVPAASTTDAGGAGTHPSAPVAAVSTESACQTVCPVVLNPDPLAVERLMAEISALRSAVGEIRHSYNIEVDSLHTEIRHLRERITQLEGEKDGQRSDRKSGKKNPSPPSNTRPKQALEKSPTSTTTSEPPRASPLTPERKEPAPNRPSSDTDKATDLSALQNPKPGTQTLLLGDSILRGLHGDLMSVTGTDKAQVVSVSGLDRAGILQHLHDADPTNAVTTVVMHVGINDCKRGFVIGKKGWKDVISAARRVFPKAEIFISSILPTINERQQPDPCVTDTNLCLREVCHSLKVNFIDNDQVFYTRTGEVKSGWFRDAIHPNKRGTSALAVNIKRAYSGRTSNIVTRPTEARHQNPHRHGQLNVPGHGGKNGHPGPRDQGPQHSQRPQHAASSSLAPRFREEQAVTKVFRMAPRFHQEQAFAKDSSQHDPNHADRTPAPFAYGGGSKAGAAPEHKPQQPGYDRTSTLMGAPSYMAGGRPVYPYPYPKPPTFPYPPPPPPPGVPQLSESDCAALFSLLQKFRPRAGN